MHVELYENEIIDDLQCNNLKIIQNNKFFKYGIDAVLLANFIKSSKKCLNIVDFGTGTGIISILLTGKINVNKIFAIEVQENVAEMAKRSVLLNDLQNVINILNINLKDVNNYLQQNFIDIVVSNPPYQSINTGAINDVQEKKISKHEILCNIEDICEKSKYLLKNNGELFLVHRPNRIADIFCALRKYNIEPKEIQFVQSKIKEKPVLVLIKAVKNGKNFLKILDPLIIYDENGNYTQEINKIYGNI